MYVEIDNTTGLTEKIVDTVMGLKEKMDIECDLFLHPNHEVMRLLNIPIDECKWWYWYYKNKDKRRKIACTSVYNLASHLCTVT